MAILSFKKNKLQEDFVFSPYRKTAYAGAIRAGKTWGGLGRMLFLMDKMPGSRFLVARESYMDLYSTTLSVLFQIVAQRNGGSYDRPGPYVLKWDGQMKELYLKNGGLIYCRHGSEVSVYKGLEISGYVLDQAEEFDEEIFNHISSRLSWWNTDRRSKFKEQYGFYPKNFEILLANPDPGWVRGLLFENIENPLDTRWRQWQVYETDIEHNRANLGPEYVDNLYATHPKDWCDRFLKGSWDIRGGQIYKEYNEDIHVVDDFEIPKHWQRYMAMDWGINEFHRCVTLWGAVDEEGTLWIYRELSVTGLLASEVAAQQKLLTQPFDKEPLPRTENGGLIAYFDPSTDHRGGIVERTIMDEFALHGVYGRKANNDVHAGINKVGEFLHINPITGKPRLKIFKSCKWLRRGMKLYQWKPGSAEGQGTDQPLKRNDDECDTARYLIMSVLEDKTAPIPKDKNNLTLYNEMILSKMLGKSNDDFLENELSGYSTETFLEI